MQMIKYLIAIFVLTHLAFNASAEVNFDLRNAKIFDVIEAVGKMLYQEHKNNLTYPRYAIPNIIDDPDLLPDIKRLAEYGDPRGQFQLAQLYEAGVAVQSVINLPVNTKLKKLLQGKPFDLDVDDGVETTEPVNVSQAYIKKDIDKAIALYKAAAEKSDMKAKYQLGLLYLQGTDEIESDFEQAYSWLESAAFQGNAYAAYVLGIISELGLGDKPDLSLAMNMYSLAAVSDYPPAKLQLANLYLSGKLDSPPPHKRVAKLYQESLDAGIEEAKLNAAFYAATSPDEEKQQWAFQTAHDLAATGNSYAQLLLALLYDRGIGTSRNPEEATKLFNAISLPE